MTIRKFYDADLEGGSGVPTPSLSLAELDALPDNPTPPVNPGIASGDGTPPIFNIANPTETDPPVADDITSPANLDVDPPKEEGEESAGEDPTEFYKTVEQLTGEPLTVEYGDTDPLSPQGVAMRESTVREDAVMKFEKHLQETDPRGYAYLLHRSSGGDDESFFAEKSYVLPDTQDFAQSVELQTQVLKQDLLDRGVPPEVVDSTIANYTKNNLLTEKATIAYNHKVQAQEQQMAKLQQEQEQEQRAMQQQINNITGQVTKSITDGTLGLVVPESKKVAFNEYVKNNIRYDNGEFFVVNKLGENLKEVLEAQYFQFVKGDLSALIQNGAKAIATQRLRTVVNKAGSRLAGSEPPSSTSKTVSLGSL